MDLEIAVMIIDDYETVYELWKSTDGMGLRSLDDSKNGISKFIKRNPNTSFVCKIDNKIVGAILSGHDGRRGYIYHAVVSKQHRNKGIGKKLVEAVVNALADEDIKKVALVVFADNDKGNGFWESVGFSRRDDLIYRNMVINEMNV